MDLNRKCPYFLRDCIGKYEYKDYGLCIQVKLFEMQMPPL